MIFGYRTRVQLNENILFKSVMVLVSGIRKTLKAAETVALDESLSFS